MNHPWSRPAASGSAAPAKCQSPSHTSTQVCFAPLSRAEIQAYWESGEPRGKAGAYAIQGLGAVFVTGISGTYTGVMGLPLFETAHLLRQAGIPVWDGKLPGQGESTE